MITDPLETRPIDVISMGEALVDFLPSQRGPLASVPSFERHAGGAPANVAVGVARLGGQVAFVGTVGADPFGTFLRAALQAEGVDTTLFLESAAHRTGLAFVSLDALGRPKFFAAGGNAAELAVDPALVERVPFERARAFHLSTGLLRGESARAATFRAVERAREAGCLVAFDPNLRLHHWKDPAPLAKDIDALLAQVDVVKLSSDEIAFVTGATDPLEAARSLVRRGPALAIVTCGPDGCVYARRDFDGALPGQAIEIVDTTGAGDGFQASLLASLTTHLRAGRAPGTLDRETLVQLLERANEVGAKVCGKVGAMPGLPTLAEL